MQAYDVFDFENLNPGEELKKYLKVLVPKGSLFSDEDLEESDYISRIDYYFKHESEYFDLVYESSINFLLRRLIKSAHYFKKKSEKLDDYSHLDNTRNYLEENTRFGEEEIERILVLLDIIINYSKRTPSPGTKKSLLRKAREDDLPCYICGRAIDFNDCKSWEFVQIEHCWPQKMGGANTPFNLKIACRKCNSNKEEYIDSSDFHYEHIAYKTILEENINHVEFKYPHKLAIWAKSNFSCTICERSAAEVGALKLGRKNKDDTWHYMNIVAFCDEHYNII